MSAATEDREKGPTYADGTCSAILYAQHATVHELLEAISTARGGRSDSTVRTTKTLLKAPMKRPSRRSCGR